MTDKPSESDGLRGLQRFLNEAKEILKGKDAEKEEKIDTILERLTPAIAANDHALGRSNPTGPTWGQKPLVSPEAADPKALFSDSRARMLAKVTEAAKDCTPAPANITKALEAWLKDKWKTAAYWESKDLVEQTWDLQQLVRKLFKAGGINREPEFKKDSRQWGSEIIGEQKKISFGLPSVVFAVHETIHLAMEEEDEHNAWVATVRLLTDAYKDIDPSYAQSRLEAEFDNPQQVPVAKSKGWSQPPT